MITAETLDAITGEDEEQTPLPKGWRLVKLSEISSVISKGTTPSSLGHNFTTNGIPFLRAEDVIGKEVNSKTVSFHISPETHSVLSRSKLIPGDLVITIAGTLGRVGYLPANSVEMNCNQAVAFARLNPNIVDIKFACFACQRQEIKNLIAKIKAGGGIPNLNLQQIQEILLPLPPMQEQKRIVAVLDEQMNAVAQARAAVEAQLEAINKLPAALLRKAFAGEI